MTESTQIQATENNSASIIKMEPMPILNTAASTISSASTDTNGSNSNNNNSGSAISSSADVLNKSSDEQTGQPPIPLPPPPLSFSSDSTTTAASSQQHQQLFMNQHQHYALKWNDYQSSILNSFRHLRDEEDFVDVTIACDDQRSFTAHKVVLSACSPYFRRLLKANPCEHPIIILRDVAADDVENLLR